MLFIVIAIWSWLAVFANTTDELKAIYDGKLLLKPTSLSGSEELLMKSKILPAARKFWDNQEDDLTCGEDSESVFLDIAKGSFTRPGANQKAILYRYCDTGHNFALNGIVVIEDSLIIFHIAYSGGWDSSIGALPDINGNGLSEIVVSSGGSNMGKTWKVITVIELSKGSIKKFGQTQVYWDNCGEKENGTAEAYKLFVRKGQTPSFYRETFINKKVCEEIGSWKKSETLKTHTLDEDSNEYQFIK